MFKSGESKAKRRARQAAAAQYMKEFKKIQPIPVLQRLDTNNRRTVEDSLGDGASARTRNMARKADRVAREINNDEDYNRKVNLTNDRYAILKEQMANRSTTRFKTTDNPTALPVAQNNGWGNSWGGGGGFGQHFGGPSFNNFGGGPAMGGAPMWSSGTAMMYGNNGGILNRANRDRSSFADGVTMHKTREEALAEATNKMNAYNKSKEGTHIVTRGFFGQNNRTPFQPITDASRFVNEENFEGFGVLYRDLGKAERALNDVNALGTSVANSQGNTSITNYTELAKKLKPLVKKEAENAPLVAGNKSIISHELAQNNYTETM